MKKPEKQRRTEKTDLNTNFHRVFLSNLLNEAMSEMIDEKSLDISCKGNGAH